MRRLRTGTVRQKRKGGRGRESQHLLGAENTETVKQTNIASTYKIELMRKLKQETEIGHYEYKIRVKVDCNTES